MNLNSESINKRVSCSVVIPVYNSESTLQLLMKRLEQTLSKIAEEYEVILVNDGSQDQSWQIIETLSHQHSWIVGINLMRNYGQHNALLCGVRTARYPICVTMDDDLQHPPEEIPKLIAKLQEGHDVVYGIPNKLPHSLWRNFFSYVTKRILAFIMNVKTVKDIGSFRAFRTDLRKAFSRYQSPGVILDALLSWGTVRFSSVTIEANPREQGKSNYNFAKLVGQALLILTGFSTVPLRFASWLGFFATLFGIAIFLYVVITYLAAGSIPGFPFLASIISIFSGTQLFALGIFGEYLARVFDRSMEHPAYIVEVVIRDGKIIGLDDVE
jgi:glycosyltransferase involved in cell wall biosynthesis